ncbi:MAG: SDR family NAD(P)-dependent oxidoreductase [Tannerella sp.]|jgi:short-subunit dehydrogenase|nr:SDR family NAD(P)-dependent oxidoreductase [Tannerella sp.]
MKRAIIVGATSGIGREVAKEMLNDGWILGIAGRREEELKTLQALAPDRISIQILDVTNEDAPGKLHQLIDQVGGMDLFFLSSGIGKQNRDLNPDIEIPVFQTNVTGFGRMVIAAFQYFKIQKGGHIAVISSIAGTKGLGSAPAYSATKRFQNTYIESLSQLACMEQLNICFTDIRPGFVKTAILNDANNYPMLMKPDYVARHIIKAIKRRRKVVVIDWRYALLVFFWQMIPRWLWIRLKIQTKRH